MNCCRRFTAFAIALTLGACSDRPPSVEAMRVRLVGDVWLDEPIAAKLNVFERETGALFASTESRAETGYALEADVLPSSVRIEVSLPQRSVNYFVDAELNSGDRDQSLHLTPLRGLVDTYASVLEARGEPEPELEAQLAWRDWAGFDLRAVRPRPFNEVETGELDPGLRYAFLLSALREASAESGIGVGPWLTALREDLEADGLFDGPYAEGLRGDLGDGLRVFAAARRNPTPVKTTDILEFAQRIKSSRAPFFGAPVEIDRDGPQLERMEVVATNGSRPLADAEVFVTGSVVIEAAVSDPSGVSWARMALDRTTIVDQDERRENVTIGFDAVELSEGVHVVTLETEDNEGNVSMHVGSIITDLTPPVLTVGQLVASAGGPRRVTGSAYDDLSGVDVVLIHLAGRAPIEAELTGQNFTALIPEACAGIVMIEAIDVAGNATSVDRNLICDRAAPEIRLLPTEYQDERYLGISLSGANVVGYSSLAGGIVEISESSMGEPMFYKYFNRLDDLPGAGGAIGNNLPVYRFEVTDDVAGPEDLSIELRAEIAGTPVSNWEDVDVDAGIVDVPVSYQVFGTALAEVSAADVLAIQLRARDAVGNTRVRSMNFRLRVLAPPMVIARCGNTSYADSRSLVGGSMHELFSGTRELFKSDVVSAAARPQGSLSPDPTMSVDFEVAFAHAELDVGRDKFLTSGFNAINPPVFGGDCYPPGLHTSCTDRSYARTSPVPGPGSDFGCFTGLYPDEGFVWSAANDLTEHELLLSASDLLGAPLAIPNRRLTLSGGGYAQVVQRAALEVRFAGQLFLWGTTVANHSGPGEVPDWASRYRPPLAIQGAPFNLYGRDLQFNCVQTPSGRLWTQGLRTFVTSPHVKAVSVRAPPLSATASYTALPNLPVDVLELDGCGWQQQIYSSLPN